MTPENLEARLAVVEYQVRSLYESVPAKLDSIEERLRRQETTEAENRWLFRIAWAAVLAVVPMGIAMAIAAYKVLIAGGPFPASAP